MKHIILPLVLALALPAYGSELKLKVYRDDENTADTVYNALQYVIAVTEPGATATINGSECHVYKTGSFGAEVNLVPGDNAIAITAQKGKQRAKTTSRYYYIADRPAPVRKATPKPTAFDTPVAVTTLKGAYLQYGSADDRLGGSKMGFLDPGITLWAVAEAGDLYKIMLGDKRSAYIEKGYTEPAAEGIVPAAVNTSSATVTNMGGSDRIVIALPRRLAYTSRADIDPVTLYVTMYGAMNNTNWLTQCTAELGIVDFVDLIQDGDDELTMAIRLKDKNMWGYSVHYDGNSLVVDIRHRPASLALSDLTIGLDAGHGGQYPGAWSPSGLKEKDVNLDIVLRAADILRSKGAKVVLTRDGDTGPSMTERKRIWLEGNVDIAISVHNNASGNPLIPMGTSTYYKYIQNRGLATALHDSMLSLGLADFGLTGNFNFSLNGPTEYPNALVEALFMSSLPEEELLADEAYRATLAAKIVEGLENYLKAARDN